MHAWITLKETGSRMMLMCSFLTLSWWPCLAAFRTFFIVIYCPPSKYNPCCLCWYLVLLVLDENSIFIGEFYNDKRLWKCYLDTLFPCLLAQMSQ